MKSSINLTTISNLLLARELVTEYFWPTYSEYYYFTAQLIRLHAHRSNIIDHNAHDSQLISDYIGVTLSKINNFGVENIQFDDIDMTIYSACMNMIKMYEKVIDPPKFITMSMRCMNSV